MRLRSFGRFGGCAYRLPHSFALTRASRGISKPPVPPTSAVDLASIVAPSGWKETCPCKTSESFATRPSSGAPVVSLTYSTHRRNKPGMISEASSSAEACAVFHAKEVFPV